MISKHLFFIPLLVIFNALSGQTLAFKCTEKEIKDPEGGEDPIFIKTCYIGKYKFKETSYPDYKGRYSSESKVYVLANKKYRKTLNSEIFNKKQNELVMIINKRIHKDFYKMAADTMNKECFSEHEICPNYKMNDLQIIFQNNKIFFEAKWAWGACFAVGFTMIEFKLSELQKYLKE